MEKFLSLEEEKKLKIDQKKADYKKVYVKITVLLMLNNGHSPQVVAQALGVDTSTVYRYLKLYEEHGFSAYIENNYNGKWFLLSSQQISQLRIHLNQHLYTTSKEIIELIKTLFDVTYTESGIIDFLHNIGFSYKQTKQVPCEADSEKQKEFLATTLPKILEEVEKGEAVVYFIDGVHPTHNNRSSKGWIETGKEFEQASVSGRDRININGALNATDVTDIHIVETESVNAQSTIELLKKIATSEKSTDKKIYPILDNARYYRSKIVQEFVTGSQFELIFLPSYSPNLNLIERLWKFMRKKVINTSFYRKKEDFRASVLNFFKNIKNYKDELISLLTLNFHVINSQFKT